MPDAGACKQRILVLGLVALLGSQQPSVTENWHQHPSFDLVIRIALAQVDLERTVRNEDDLLVQQRLLNFRFQDIGERRKLDDAIDAAALRCFAPREVSCIRLVAPARRHDNIAESLCASARGHVERRVAPDRPQREPAFIVAG